MSKLEELRDELEAAMRAAKESMAKDTKQPVINIYNSDVQIYPHTPPQPRRTEPDNT